MKAMKGPALGMVREAIDRLRWAGLLLGVCAGTLMFCAAGAGVVRIGSAAPIAVTDTPPPSAFGLPSCGPNWTIVESPSLGFGDNRLRAVTVASADDIWAVGEYSAGGSSPYQTLVEHWNGTVWSLVPSPNEGTGNNILYDVAIAAADDIWAVGYYGAPNQTLIEHWNGSAWSVVPSPNQWSTDNRLYSVAVTSPGDIWAAGYYGAADAYQTLVEHWNGAAWSIITSPNPDLGINYLSSLAVVSSNDVWAVGAYWTVGGESVYRTLVEHWNGSSWSIVPSPNQGTGNNGLYGVAAISSGDIWAVGYSASGNMVQTLTEHWSGSAWSIVPSPNMGQNTNYLEDVVVASGNVIWAVGYYWNGAMTPYLTLIEHWDGSAWSISPSPNRGPADNFASGVAAAGPNDVWVVGDDLNGTTRKYETLVERYDPCEASPTPTLTTPSATPSPTSSATATATVTATASATAIATTATASATVERLTPTSVPQLTATATEMPPLPPPATATPCALSFTDVPPDSTFYPYIRCLACRGIVSGYSDGTFRPGNNITRGQIAKIVSNAANLQYDVTGRQTYADVPLSNTFWLWIERLTVHNAVSGYPCGGPGEPCDEQNRPYFRWANSATRGQLAKIVSNAAGYGEEPSGQMFADVPPSDTFYRWVQRLASRGIIGGYQCGGPGEPCDPENRPYFRPSNSVTRGQAAKIVSNTFYPGCQSPSRR